MPEAPSADAKEEPGSYGYKQFIQEVRRNRQEYGHDVCAFCEKIDYQAPDAGRFKVCGKCKTIGRTVRYCSRECQADHWKRGRPPHKLVCGKPISEHPVSVDSTQPSYFALLPPADPSYARSPALLHLMKLLSEKPELDYLYIHAYPEPDHGLCLGYPLGPMFRIYRDRAFKSGDPQAVRAMWSFLLPQAEKIAGYGKEGLRSQLRKEYGFDPESTTAC